MRIIIGTFSHRRLLVLSRRFPFDIFMSLATHSISYAFNIIHLTISEFKLFFLLAVKKDGTVSEYFLIDILYGEDRNGGAEFAAKCVRRFIHQMRIKLHCVPSITIVNFHGMGYTLKILAPQCFLEAA